jgi:hypothetical protein
MLQNKVVLQGPGDQPTKASNFTTFVDKWYDIRAPLAEDELALVM